MDNLKKIGLAISSPLLGLTVCNYLPLKENENTEDVIEEKEKLKKSLLETNVLFEKNNVKEIRENIPSLIKTFEDHKEFFEFKLFEMNSDLFERYNAFLEKMLEILKILK